MNFIEKLERDLEANGMFPDQVQAVMVLFMEDNNKTSMGQRVYEDVNNYPEMIYNILWLTCKTFALKYIDETCPKAWFRAAFLPPNEQDEYLKSIGYVEKVLEKNIVQPIPEVDQT